MLYRCPSAVAVTPKSVPDTTTTTPTSTPISASTQAGHAHHDLRMAKIQKIMACERCGTFKKSGKASCCAPGGSWYDKCGVVGDPSAQYTWFDGIKTCKKIKRKQKLVKKIMKDMRRKFENSKSFENLRT